MEQTGLVLLIGILLSFGFGIVIPVDISGTLDQGRVLGTFAPLVPLSCVGTFFKSNWPGCFESSCSGRSVELFRGACAFLSFLTSTICSAFLLLLGAEYSIASSSFWLGFLSLGTFYVFYSFLDARKSFMASLAVTIVVLASPMLFGANGFAGDGVGNGLLLGMKLFYLALFILGVILTFFPISIDVTGRQ